ncbi:MAG: 6-phospho-3-hexuloisomerase [Thermoproteota archaeon]|jgi:6-phospho-3-hexuloisomerase
METKEIAKYLLRKINENIENGVQEKQIEEFVRTLIEAYKNKKIIGVVGAGRSGLVAKSFAMRLMHLGFNVFVIGETITPSLKSGDVLLAVSGSGETTFTVSAANVAKRIGAKVISLTSYPNSRLGELSDVKVVVPGRVTKASDDDYFSRQLLGIHEPLAPLGTLFELSTGILLDAIVVELMEALNIRERDMMEKHATIE